MTKKMNSFNQTSFLFFQPYGGVLTRLGANLMVPIGIIRPQGGRQLNVYLIISFQTKLLENVFK